MSRASTDAAPGRGPSALKALFHWMPLIFGALFIAPLVAQAMDHWGLAAPFGLGHLSFGLAVGVPWGFYAVVVGRWL